MVNSHLSFLRYSSWSLDVMHILVVFLADVLHEFFSRPQACGKVQLKRSGIRPGIIDSNLVDQRSHVLSRPAFDGVKLFRMRVAAKIEPELVIESDRVDHQRVAFPSPDRMSIPRRVRILWMLPAIHEDLAVAVNVALEQEEDVRRSLNDPPRIGRDSRDSRRQAVRLGIVLRLPRFHDLSGCGQQRNRFALRETHFQITDRTAAIPDSGQVWFSIRKPGCRPGWHGRPPLQPAGPGRRFSATSRSDPSVPDLPLLVSSWTLSPSRLSIRYRSALVDSSSQLVSLSLPA